jgi:ketosteroid isomerase-like protein
VTTDTASGPAADLARRFWVLFARRDWDSLRDLFHPDARIELAATGPRIFSPDEAVAEFEHGSENPAFAAIPAETAPINDEAVIVRGSLRTSDARGGHALSQHAWLYIERDGLLYRMRAFESEARARTAYVDDGPTLGLS